MKKPMTKVKETKEIKGMKKASDYANAKPKMKVEMKKVVKKGCK